MKRFKILSKASGTIIGKYKNVIFNIFKSPKVISINGYKFKYKNLKDAYNQIAYRIDNNAGVYLQSINRNPRSKKMKAWTYKKEPIDMSGYSWEKLKSEHRKNAKKLGLKFGNFGWVGTKDSILSKTDKGYFGTTYVGPGKYENEFETYESIRKNGSKLMKRKTRKKRIVRRKRRVVRRNPGVKQGFALIRGGGPTGMKMVVVSTHKTREGAETAMIKKGGTPQSLFTKGYSIFAFGPGTRYEYLDTEFTGKFLRPIVGNRRRGLRGNPGFASLHPSDRATLNKFLDYVYSYYGKGGLYARDFKNRGFDRRTIERAIMVYIGDVRKGKTEWGGGDTIDRERVRTILQPSYLMFIPKEGTVTIRSNSRRGLRRNGVMADAENEFLMKYGLTPDQARAKFFSMMGTSFEKAKKLSFEEKVKIRDEYEVFKKKLLKAKMSMRRR